MELLNAGRPREAAQILARQPVEYANFLKPSGINLTHLQLLNDLMAALKVLVDALM